MITAEVTSKGQVTLPKAVREKLGVQPGENVGFEEQDGLLVIRKVVTESPLRRTRSRISFRTGTEVFSRRHRDGAWPFQGQGARRRRFKMGGKQFYHLKGV